MSEATKAVFLSYARDDAAAARRIAEALRASGLEVWFDENELRGGDAWDAKIRQQIDACALFLAVISKHTQERSKGYFRLEWKLAVDQTHLLAAGVPFIAPVVVDDTPEGGAMVPPEFMRVQWMRLPGALPTPQFVEQVNRLLGGKPMEAGRPRPAIADPAEAGRPGSATSAIKNKRPLAAVWIALGVVALSVGVVFFVTSRRESPEEATRRSAPPTSAAPDPRSRTQDTISRPTVADAKSIAVLPFANLSADTENAFFADGVHDEVITSLARIRDLRVISRTSVLVYRDSAARNLKQIAAEFGVATVLEGSVRRAGNKVRVTAQLIDARTDEHLWADTYDGDLSDIFALQARLAQQIAGALKATLTGSERALIERRPTSDPEAYDLYLRARALHQDIGERGSLGDYERVIGVYEQAIARDPNFALAQAQVAQVHSVLYWFGFLDPTPARAEKMKRAVDAAKRLAPDAPETRKALGAYHYRVRLDWPQALAELRAAEVGLPNDAQLGFWLAITHRRLGRWTEALAHFERSVSLNPRDLASLENYTGFLNAMRRPEQALAAISRFQAYFPTNRSLLENQAEAQLLLGGGIEAYARTIETLPADPADPAGVGDRFAAACWRGDLAAADRILAGAPGAFLPEPVSNVIRDPVEFHRAFLAFLRGDATAARQFADRAIAAHRAGSSNQRQQPWIKMRLAQADAWAGRSDEAVRGARAALAEMIAQDFFDAVQLRRMLGMVLVAADRREEALACLREMMMEPGSLPPAAARVDPLWSRLKDDPRFEEILRSAKPL